MTATRLKYVKKSKFLPLKKTTIKTNNEREYYHVAYTVNDEKTFKREISAFKNIKDNYPKYLLTLDFDNTNIEGIQKIKRN
jgi:hypothetical protein